MCPSLGLEHLRGRRAFRHLAARLSASGIASLRFDLPGIGNSTAARSDNSDGAHDLVERWSSAIDCALHLASTLRQGAPLILVGRRFGALMAVAATARHRSIHRLVLWDPCVSGASFVRELRMLEATRVRHELLDPAYQFAGAEVVESLGYAYSPTVIAAMESYSLTQLHPRDVGRTFCVTQRGAAKISKVLDAWTREGCEVERRDVDDAAFDSEDWRSSNVPDETLTCILEECVQAVTQAALSGVVLSDAHTETERPAVPVDKTIGFSIARSSPDLSAHEIALTERVVRFGADQRFLGYLTEPAAEHRRDLGIVVLRTLGGNGAHVRLARHWASLGASVVRVDLSGIEESLPRGDAPENFPYPDSGIEDVREIVAWMRSRLGASATIAVFGFCAEAFYAVMAASDGVAIDHVVAVNPPLYWSGTFDVDFTSIAGVVAEHRASNGAPLLRRLFALVGDPDWKARLGRAVNLRLARVLNRSGRSSGSANAGGLPILDLPTIFPSHVRWHLLYSHGDPGLLYLLSHDRDAFESTKAQPGFEITVAATSDHLFLGQGDRAWLHASMTSRLPFDEAAQTDK